MITLDALSTFPETSWKSLLNAVKEHRCLPIIGSQVCPDVCENKTEIARALAKAENYPFHDPDNLPRVMQYLSVLYSPPYASSLLKDHLPELSPEASAPYKALAGLPFSTYVTTDFGDQLCAALRAAYRNPTAVACRWRDERPSLEDDVPEPTAGSPLVFHACGRFEEPETLVLTEDDFLDFAMSISRTADLIPAAIDQALARSFLLLLGFRFRDPDLWVLLRILSSWLPKNAYSRNRLHVALQLAAPENYNDVDSAVQFLSKYFETQHVSICFLPLPDFLQELHERYEAAK